MINQNLEPFLQWAKEQGWQLRRNRTGQCQLDGSVTKRYQVPESYLEFLGAVRSCISPQDTAWFLCEEDYAGGQELMFRWNELELMSLAAAEDKGNKARMERIVRFWDGAMPFFVSVGGGYGFFALDTKEHPGAVLYGCEPYFEKAQQVAEDLDGFLSLLMKGEIELAE